MPNRLSDMVFDEVSLVYKGANQHSRVAIAKSADGVDEEESMEYTDQDGNPVDVESLQEGDVVFDEEGQGFVYTEQDVAEDADDNLEYEDEPELVGKAFGRIGSAVRNVGAYTKGTGQAARGYAKNTVGPGLRRNRNSIIAGSAGVVAGGGAGAGGTALLNRRNQPVGKSFEQDFRSKLSKALTDDDRDDVIASAVGYIGHLEEVAKSAQQAAEEEREIRRQAEMLEIAKSYTGLPVSDEDLATTLLDCSDNLDPKSISVLQKCLSAASDAALLEVGSSGGGYNSDVMAVIEEHANQGVAKSGDYSSESQIVKAFESDPTLYEQYLDETGGYNTRPSYR